MSKLTYIFKYFAIAITFSAAISMAQEVPAQNPAPATEPAAAQPAAPAAEPAAAEPAAEAPAEGAAPAEAAAEAAPEPAPEPAPAPAPEPAPVVVAEPVPEAPAVEQKEPMVIKFHLGARGAFGISAMRNHNAINFAPNPLRLGPALSFSAGIASAFEFSKLPFDAAPEIQYTLYRANEEYYVKTPQSDFKDVNQAGVRLHAIEIPVFFRFAFLGQYYAEVGPQLGINIGSRVYKNSEEKQPETKTIAFGPSLGGGINVAGFLLGIRGHLGILEYADNTNGYPWTVQASATKFFF